MADGLGVGVPGLIAAEGDGARVVRAVAAGARGQVRGDVQRVPSPEPQAPRPPGARPGQVQAPAGRDYNDRTGAESDAPGRAMTRQLA